MSNDYLSLTGFNLYELTTLVACGLFIAALLASVLRKGRKSVRFSMKAVAVSLLFALTWAGQGVTTDRSGQSLAVAMLVVAPIAAVIYGACAISSWRSEQR